MFAEPPIPINILIALFSFLAAFYAVRFICLFLTLLRTPLQIRSLAKAGSDYVPTPLHRKVLEDLAALGFHSHITCTFTGGNADEYGFILMHDSLPITASVALRPWLNFHYQVDFTSHMRDGTQLCTVNLLPGLLPFAKVQWFNVSVTTLAEQFNAHVERIKNMDVTEVTLEEALSSAIAFTQLYNAYQESVGKFVRTKSGEIYYSTCTAFAIAWEIFRMRKALKRGFKGFAQSEEYQSRFFAECYQYQERASQNRKKGRPGVTWGLLAATLGLSFVLWGWSTDWYFGLALILVLLVHETGHALAMRAFGYRDMSMFFIPMMGAVVTGKIENISAWKQGVILFAGPMPGLLFGLVLMLCCPSKAWLNIASIAVLTNLFNLIPMVPLDGGRLLEIALLARWPRFIAVFYWLSSLGALALGLYLKDSFLPYLLAYVMIKMAIHQQRVLSLTKAWDGEKGNVAQLPALFALARERVKHKQSFLVQSQLVRAVFKPSVVNKPSLGETTFIMGLFVSLWLGTGVIYLHFEHIKTARQHFDDAYDEYDDLDGNTNTPEAKTLLLKMEKAGAQLTPDDKRHNDLDIILYATLPFSQAKHAYERMLETHRFGFHINENYLAYLYLEAIHDYYPAGIPEAREPLEEGIALVERNTSPDTKLSNVVRAKLWLAESYDAADSTHAQAIIDALLKQTPYMNAYWHELVLRAQIWFDIDKGKPGDAITFLQHSSVWPFTPDVYNSLEVDYGWALLQAGRTEDGLDYIKRASVRKYKTRRKDGTPPLPLHHIDLAYAYLKTGKILEMKYILSDLDAYECDSFDQDNYDLSGYGVWQRKRNAAIKAMLTSYCPTH